MCIPADEFSCANMQSCACSRYCVGGLVCVAVHFTKCSKTQGTLHIQYDCSCLQRQILPLQWRWSAVCIVCAKWSMLRSC
jgi:hypothetical protein